jgi:hypothetical protein
MEREREREREREGGREGGRSKGKVEGFSSIIYLFRGDMLKTTTDGRGDGACKSLCPLFKYNYTNTETFFLFSAIMIIVYFVFS